MLIVSLLVLTTLAMLSPSSPGAIGLVVISLLAVGLEQLSRWGIDNLSVPIAVGISWHWMTI